MVSTLFRNPPLIPIIGAILLKDDTTDTKVNNKIILAILLIFGISIFSGCVGQKDAVTPGGKVKVQEGAPGWCSTGTKVETSGEQGQGTYEIKGMTTYKGKSVCEAEMKVTGAPGMPGGGSVWKYYFTENNEYAVMVMKDPQGNEQEIVVSDPTGKTK